VAPVSIVCGVLLVVLGLVFYAVTGLAHPTALIPVPFGLLLVLLGFVALKESLRKHAMHLAAVVGLLGFLGGAIMGLRGLPGLIAGTAERPLAVVEQLLMAVISLVLVALCVRSFVVARMRRKQGPSV
jgi:hypothetical protein